ncbi:MAG: PH domain-containing protein [Sphingopyxis sp.]|nr:PH domain-containing protein [Sphingopyxis sp.]
MASRSRPVRLEASDLPYVIQRPIWAACVAFAIGLLFAASAFGILWLLADGLAAGLHWYQLLFSIVVMAFFGMAAVIGFDRSFGFQLTLDIEGVRISGLFTQRLLTWQEITGIRFRRGRWYGSVDVYIVGHIAIQVDGSNNPRRHWSSLWFGYYDIPRLMDLRAKELTALLSHAKRRADAGWPEAAPRTRQKAG